jgi:hypothetical protein
VIKMRTIYIDSDYRCHTSNHDGTFREVETNFFDGKCDAFIEGYRYVPEGENWTRNDGAMFTGEMIAPAVDYESLHIAQVQYENQDMENALAILLGGGNV